MPKRAYTFHPVFYLALAATFLIYSVGLGGPFILDDEFNLAPLKSWLAGQIGWREVVFDNASGPLGRPVSMLSFLFSAWVGGVYPYHYKLGNLIVHLGCGALIALLLQRLLRKDARLSAYATVLAAGAAALWLLHPLHASTVLYSVQRMAQLSCLFTLAAVLAYVCGRERLAAGQLRAACVWLFLAMPLLWLLGMLSKENAAVASALCLVLELAYFSRDARARKVLAWFYLFALVVPLLAAAVVVAIKPGLVFAGYELRDFDLGQRLLTQPRALMAYIGLFLLPRGSELGLFTDGFAASTSLFAPVSTALSIAALIAISAFAIAWRKRSPGFFAGWFFFLVAHAVESSILPLELYYEHRNYLPSVGLFLALIALLAPIVQRCQRSGAARAVALAAWALAAVALGFSTYQQARIWSSKDSLVEHAYRNHPDSVRAAQSVAIAAINRGRYNQALDIIGPLARSPNPRTRSLAFIDMTSVACLRGYGADPTWLDSAVANARSKLTLGEIQAAILLLQSTDQERCAAIGQRKVADTLRAMADKATDQSDDLLTKWQLRYGAAIAYSRAGLWPQAQTQAELAWHASGSAEIGGLLAQAYAHNGNPAQARAMIEQIRLKIRPGDLVGQKMLDDAAAALPK